MSKVYLSPSCQYDNAYAYGNTTEAAQCIKIAKACKTALERCGISVKRPSDNSLVNRCAESDKWGADLHVPIHTNAFNKKTTGTRVYYYDGSTKGYNAAKAIYGVLAPFTPGTSESVSANHGRAQYTGVRLERRAYGLYAVPVRTKSGLITNLAGTDGYFCIDRDCEGLPAGAEVSVIFGE